jgi:hypothetical protein
VRVRPCRAHTIAATLLLGGALAPAAAAQPAPADGWVVLPVGEYRTLRDLAYPRAKAPAPPPVAATLSRVEYDLRVAGEAAVGQVVVTVDVLGEGWVRMPIPSGLRVRDARLDGRPVALVDAAAPPGAREVLLGRRGRSRITLDVAIPVTAQGASQVLSLPASPAAVSRAAVQLPQADAAVTLTGGLSVEPVGDRYVAFGRPGQPMVLAWGRRRDDRRAGQPLRLRGRVTELVGLAEDAAQTTAEVEVEVVQGAADAVQIALPEAFVVNEVSGPLVADWEVRGATLAVSFLAPLETTTRLVVTGDGKIPRSGTLRIPLLRLPAAERETGGLAVEVLGAGEIQSQDARGLDPADPSDLGEIVAGRESPALTALRFRPQDGRAARSLSVTVTRFTPQASLVANVEEARYRALLTEDGKTLVQARFAVRNNRRSFLGLTLPPGASLWSASVAGRRVRPGVAPDGSFLLPLAGVRSGEDAPAFPVEVVLLARSGAWEDRGQARLVLPAVDLPISRTGLVVHHSPRFQVEVPSGTFRVAAFEAPASPALRMVSVDGDARVAEAGAKDKANVGADVQKLVDRYQKESRLGARPGISPVAVPFPAVGPALYLAAELSEAGQATSVDLGYKRREKR